MKISSPKPIRSLVLAAVTVTAAVAFFSDPFERDARFGVSVAKAETDADAAAGAPLNPCAPPNKVVGSAEETAWRLWVAATCPVNNTKYPFVVWENWIEQAQMYPAKPANGLEVPNAQAAAGGTLHRLHESPLAVVKNRKLLTLIKGLLGGADQNCNKAATPPSSQPNLVICEEVRLNGATEDYVAGTDLWNRAGQATAAKANRDIQFSRPSIEVKADWIALSSIGLKCNALPTGFTSKIHVETINGNCYALAGMHFISKLIDKWIWATFEPQEPITNPNRCKVLGCTDGFGSNPAITHGAATKLTPDLAALMKAADLSPEWSNYRLDGVQVDFFIPQLLGNSIIEGENAGVPLTQSSCITCHDVSSVKTDGTDGIKLLTSNPVGAPKPLPPGWIHRDFLWSLSEACPNSPFQTCAK